MEGHVAKLDFRGKKFIISNMVFNVAGSVSIFAGLMMVNCNFFWEDILYCSGKKGEGINYEGKNIGNYPLLQFRKFD